MKENFMSEKKYHVPRRYSLIKKFRSDEAIAWDLELAEALNELGHNMSGSEAYFHLMELGVEAVLQMKADRNFEELSTFEKARKALRIEEEKKSELQTYARLYEELGLDGFVKWAEEAGYDWEPFLEEYNLFKQGENITWAEYAFYMLRHYLSDGKPHHTSEIKDIFSEIGAIDNTTPESLERDWAKLRQVAHRNGLTTGIKSQWQYVSPQFE
jgi:hypothetical protein